MASRRPLVVISGVTSELPTGDTVIGSNAGTLVAGSGLIGGGLFADGNTVTVDISIAPAASGLIFVGDSLGIDGTALANTTALLNRTITAGSGLLGGGTLSADRRIDANISTQAAALSGTENTSLMTPLRVAQAIAAQGSTFTYTSTGSNKTLVNGERCTAISGFITLSLPSAPGQGNTVSVIIPSGSINVNLSGVGSRIMGIQQDLLIDSVDKTVTLVYTDATYGWRVF